jgi:hypothetical protein
VSNALARKRKRMQPLGYTKDELLRMQRYAKTQSNTNDLIEESFLNIRLISFQILHDKFGFGYKRLMKVEKIITEYLNTTAAGGLSTEQLQFYMREKCGIDAKAEANRVPFRESFSLVERKIAPGFMQTAGKFLAASICNYYALLGVCLKTGFNFSKRQVAETLEWIRYYINSLATGYETMTGIASVMEQECKYCDPRFIGKTYEV